MLRISLLVLIMIRHKYSWVVRAALSIKHRRNATSTIIFAPLKKFTSLPFKPPESMDGWKTRLISGHSKTSSIRIRMKKDFLYAASTYN